VLRTVEGGGPIAREQRVLTTNNVNGDIAYRLSGRFSLQTAATYTMTNIAGTDLGDYMTYGGRIGISYIFDENITLRAYSSYTLFNYKIDGRSDSIESALGANWRLTPTLTVGGYGGIVTTRVERTGTRFNGFSSGLSVAKNFERGNASLAYTYGVSAGIQSTSPLRAQVLTLQWAMPVTERIDASVNTFYGIYRSLDSTTVNTAASDRNEWGGTVNIAYRLWTGVSAILSYSYVKSDDKTAGTGGGYTNNMIMLGLRVSQQARF
jgi:hypothetical protein